MNTEIKKRKVRHMKRSEMEKLVVLLLKHNIPFELGVQYYENALQVFYPSKTNPVCDVVCNPYSIGFDKGLLEMKGLVPFDDDEVEGYLDAEEILVRIECHYLAHKN
jgi:hypothetical protein